ncbi:MAG TPA: exodeoxyribonuclease I [Burkholderiales bacterium]|nr:exodeoxyribonuclease I [Burkholderiales bacterium]
MHTFLWHDYETFGVNPRRDRPAQFAAIRTDAELNEIGEPVMWYCRPAPDYLPDPQSCLITGITPQTCLALGMPEYEFARRIEQAFAQPNTVGAGYNTIRFDDEVTRFLLWRNLLDPYAREWQNNCGRWDLLDLVRATYALRPDGINWPLNAEGRVSFRLEHLTAANGLAHDAAHDALSDVRATIALARLIRQNQPRLFDYCFKLHKKEAVAEQLSLHAKRPFLHVTGMVPVERGCTMLAWPLAVHPANKNEIIAWDLAYDPAELYTLDAATVRLRLFSKSDALPEGIERLPIKSVHLNKSPVVIGQLKTLQPDRARQWQIDMEQALKYAEFLRDAPDLTDLWQQVYQRGQDETVDVDEDLYGGFIGNNDRRTLARLHDASPASLMQADPAFDDPRLEELLFRYRARNFADLLSEPDLQRWQQLRTAKLLHGAGGARTLEQLFATIDTLAETADERGEAILSALYDYAVSIAPELAD